MANNGDEQFDGHRGVAASDRYTNTRGDNSMAQNGHYYAMDNPYFHKSLPGPIDAYTLNSAYNGHYVPKRSSHVNHEPHYRGDSGKKTAKENQAKRMRQLQLYIVILVGVAVILCLAFGLGFGLGLTEENVVGAVSSRLQNEDPNKVSDVAVSVVLEDIQWDTEMADTHSITFKRWADVTERSMDMYIGRSPMATLYDRAVVSKLWIGSVGCNVRIYLNPPTDSTSKELRDIYNSIKNVSGEQTITENLQKGQDAFLSSSQQGRVSFNISTLKIISPTTTTTNIMIETTTNTATTIRTTSSNVSGTTRTSGGIMSSSTSEGTTSGLGLTTMSNGTHPTTSTNGANTTNGTTQASSLSTSNKTGETSTSAGFGSTTTSTGLGFSTTDNVTNISASGSTTNLNRTTQTSTSNGTATTTYNGMYTTATSEGQSLTTTGSEINVTSASTESTSSRTGLITTSGETTSSNGIGVITTSGETTTTSRTITSNETVATTSSSGLSVTNTSSVTTISTSEVGTTPDVDDIVHYELVGGDDAFSGYVKVKRDNQEGLLCSTDAHSNAMATYLCRGINASFYGGSNLQTNVQQKPPATDVWKVAANCYRPETDSTFSDCVQSVWEFIQEVTYYSSSENGASEKPPFMPDSNVCPLNTWSETTTSTLKMPENSVPDTCLMKLYCHTQPVAIYQEPLSNSGYIYATNDSNPLIFCRDNFTNLEAAAACKTLGYRNGGISLNFNPIPSDPRALKYSSYGYQCSGNGTIQECNKMAIDLTKTDCSGPAVVKCVDDAATEKDWDLRIDSNGYTLHVYYKGQWGTICDGGTKNPWTTKEAMVVCQELGYTHGVPRSITAVPTILRPHVIKNVICSDDAAKLSDCSYNEVNDDSCVNSFPAAVFCYNSTDVASLELVGGPEYNSGLVKVIWQNITGYLCTWSLHNEDAAVICRSFGFVSGMQDTTTIFTDPHLQYIWQTDFDNQCNPSDVLIETCRSAMWVKYAANLSQADRNCVCNGNYVSVYCYGKVKVSLEPRQRYGQLLINDGNTYHSICYGGLNQNAANAACREVTRNNTSKAVILYEGTFSSGNSIKDATFTCDENATAVSDCVTFHGSNFDCHDTSILCYEGNQMPGPAPENATEWRIDGAVVQLKAYGLWGTVCSDGWTDKEATVLCKTISMEFTIGFAATDDRLLNVPMWLNNVNCDSNNTNINLCMRKTFLETTDYCLFGEVATTFCFKGQNDVPQFSLADAEKTDFYVKGHVAVTRNSLIGYFCPSDVDLVNSHADNLCRMIGYNGGQLAQVNISKNEHTLIWNGTNTCNWDFSNCFLNGNFTERMVGNHSTSNVNGGPCDPLVPDILCFNSKVRLDYPEMSKGFLLINGQNGWTGVCTDNFTSNLAERFCTEAGYQSGNYSSSSASDAGLFAGFDSVICTEDEKFEDCTFNDLSQVCDEIVYIICSQNGNVTTEN